MGLFINNNEDELRPGDKVKIKSNGQEGIVISKKANLYTVSIISEGLLDLFEANELEKAW